MKKEKILIAGGSGLIGQFLSDFLYEAGYDIHILSRNKRSHPKYNFFEWNLTIQTIDPNALEVDHIINLTGASIADGRWTEKRKKIIIDSRVQSNQLLYQGIKDANVRIKNFLSASAIGIYGDRGNESLDENSEIGADGGFMVECCRLWEKEAYKLEELVDHLSLLRIGIVLSSKGGALSKFVLPIKLGQANYFGNGKHYYSWIHIEDLARIFTHIIQNKLSGIFNVVSPNPKTNKDFMRACKQAIAPYALLYPIPSAVMKIMMGEMSAVILNSNKVIPKKILDTDFKFKFPDLKSAVEDVRKRKI